MSGFGSRSEARGRGRLRWWLLALLFVVIPIVEIAILIQLGRVVGPWWTILILLVDGALGAFLVRREGRRAWRGLQDALASRRMPATELADGALILIGGTLLLTPGFVTDIAGLVCVLPFTRPIARRALARVISRRLTATMTGNGPAGTRGGGSRGGAHGSTPPSAGDVVPGQVVNNDT